jgi:hypothetical protein
MDHIYPTKDYKVYKIKDEAEKLMKSANPSGFPMEISEIAEFAGESEEVVREIAVDVLKTFEDYGSEEFASEIAPFDTFTLPALELNTTKLLKTENFTFKDTYLRDVTKNERNTTENQDENDIELFSDVVITIRFYEPFKYAPNMKNHPRFHQEYQVLGSNFLTDLRDKFYCVSNFGPFFDISNDPDNTEFEIKPSSDPGFFFIHDTFYNDTRKSTNTDYSEVIMKWYKNLNYCQEFKSTTMENTKFEDLQFRFGYPCLYQHQGACEHLFCITSIDLIDSTHSLIRKSYPKLVKSTNKHSSLCDLCNQLESKYQITNCPLHVKDPLFACEFCFYSFHYDREKKNKICDFQAYRIYSIRPDSVDQSESTST